MGNLEHYIYLINEAINKEYEETGEEELHYSHDVPVSLSVLDGILTLLKSQEVKEPLSDIVFFVGKPTMQSLVYHVLCRDVTVEMMRKDPNIHFMRLSKFTGEMEPDKAGKTLDDQENENRARITGNPVEETKVQRLQRELKNCRNELCLKCGNYKEAHLGACNDCRYQHGGEWRADIDD